MIDRELMELVVKYRSLEEFVSKAEKSVELNNARLTRCISDRDELEAERKELEERILPFLKSQTGNI